MAPALDYNGLASSVQRRRAMFSDAVLGCEDSRPAVGWAGLRGLAGSRQSASEVDREAKPLDMGGCPAAMFFRS